MTWLLTLLRTSRAAQLAALAAGVILVFGIWLWRHDVATREAERERIEARAREQSAKAAKAADEAQERRQEVINETATDLRNASDTDDWFERMRQRQSNSTAGR